MVHEMRRVFAEQSAFAERFENKGDIPLLQIANATVHQLGAAAGRSLGKIILFDQQGAVATRGRVHSHTKASRTSAYDQEIPSLRIFDPINCFLTSHWGSNSEFRVGLS